MKQDTDSFEKRVKLAFDNLHTSEIALMMGISPKTLDGWLKERRDIPSLRLRQISALTKASLHWLLTGEGEMRVDQAPPNPVSEDIETPVEVTENPKSNLRIVNATAKKRGEVKVVDFEGDKVGRDKIVTNNVYYRGIVNRTVNTPPPGSITEAQAAHLKELLDDLGKKLTERDGVNGYGNAHGAFKRRMDVTSYKNVPKERFEEAKQYLRTRIKAVTSDQRNAGIPPDREELLKGIFGKARHELNLTKAQVAEEARRYLDKPLSEFTRSELDRFNTYIGSKVQQQKKKKE